jgi:hypothetical protein
MDIKTLLAIASALSPTIGTTITTVQALSGALAKVHADLQTVPTHDDGTPVTLEEAAAHLATSEAAGHTQSDKIRDKAHQAIEENKGT